MSIDDGKVTFGRSRQKNKLLIGGLFILQGILSVVLCISLAAHLIWPENIRAASGSPLQISYEGRLTDASGNALGGTGTAYCFHFSIYDAASGGNKLWPAIATPSATLATSTDGVFNAIVGQADTLSSTVFDFSTTSSAYLQVDVSSASPSCSTGYEALSPRQQLLASPYAMTANNINYLRSDTANSKAQVGTNAGAGSASPVYLGLDVKNTADYVGQTCSTNGLMWYNSATTQALICENGLIQGLGTAGTTTIADISDGTNSITNGTVMLSDANGVSFGVNGNTITASVDAGGGVGTVSNYQWPPGQASSFAANIVQGGLYFGQFTLDDNLTASRAQVLALGSIVSSVSGALSLTIAVYTRNGSTLSSVSSGSQTYSYTSNASSAVSGVRRISVPLSMNATPGAYWYAVRMSTANAGSFSLYGGAKISAAFSGNLGVASATSRQMIIGIGTTTSNAMPASIAANVLQGNAAGAAMEPWILFSDFDIN